MKLLHELNGWKQVLKYSLIQIIQIKASDLNKLQKISPKFEKWLRCHVPANFIFLDEDLQ